MGRGYILIDEQRTFNQAQSTIRAGLTDDEMKNTRTPPNQCLTYRRCRRCTAGILRCINKYSQNAKILLTLGNITSIGNQFFFASQIQ